MGIRKLLNDTHEKMWRLGPIGLMKEAENKVKTEMKFYHSMMKVFIVAILCALAIFLLNCFLVGFGGWDGSPDRMVNGNHEMMLVRAGSMIAFAASIFVGFVSFCLMLLSIVYYGIKKLLRKE